MQRISINENNENNKNKKMKGTIREKVNKI